ncbi:exodeoxyribonuclease V subunit gamma [Vagococcus sp. BWB3-3]|uniref:ATP-dependent helicase/deoxyribonuclease subunit B n=1 Tax=Vagococcus allomyrinae TaxID=2794353 RepID=A0A940SWF4_9ENTE|nr:PD-(D/E)XK nuclease family protein [Vagococcus allomyrinae]MBP1043245.1 exodeoxyribonuclease V subunit gamma [Vagococcus allomyrinae]
MSLEFIYGPGSCQHETPLVERATEWLTADPKHEVFYLVPNHVKFETEVSVLENLHQLPAYAGWNNMTTMRLQVFSFSRLAWYYLQHTALYQDEHLSEAGTHMLIRKILLAQAENLSVFRGEVNKAGFIGQLADLFSELQDGSIDLADLTELLTEMGNSLKEADFKAKLQDFQLLYEEYLVALASREVGNKELISHLAEYLKERDLSQVMFVISGFSRFTAREQQLIAVLVERAAEVKLNLVLDQAYVQRPPERFNMFFDAGKLYYELHQYARSKQVHLLADTRLPDAEGQIGLVDECWRDSQEVSPSKKFPKLVTDKVQIWEGTTPFAEVSHVAKEIRRLVADEGVRYQDIQVLTRELPAYSKTIGPVFNSHEIPYYVNQELEMKHHPLVELLISLFAIQERHFRYTDVMRFLRTELFLPIEDKQLSVAAWQELRNRYRDKVDVTENVVLAYGYEGFYWTQEKDWVYIYYDFENDETKEDENLYAQRISNEVRGDLRKALLPFFAEINQAENGRQAAIALYQFLVSSGVEQEIIYWRNQDIEAGKLEEAKVHEQTWQAFIHLLDEYVAILGEDRFVLKDFVDILETGMAGLSYSKVPTTIDQVSISSVDLIHAQKNQVTFIIGATDNVLPKKIENKTLLSDEERSLIDDRLDEGKFLIKNTSADLAKEPYIAYLAFNSTADRLYLTYPATKEGSKEVKMSPYLGILSRKLGLPVQTKRLLPADFSLSTDYISTYRNLVTDLNALKRQVEEARATISPFWLELEKKLLEHPDYQELARKTFESQVHKNMPEALTPALVDALYGETIHGSVSKIESFYQCQYKYFMNYGLKLKERDVFELTPAATGDFYHDALDQLFKVLIREQLNLSELTTEELKEVTNQVLAGILAEPKFAILTTSNRMNYIRYQLGQTIQRVSWALRKQSQRTGLSTVQTEVLFGQFAQERSLDSLTIELGQNKQMSIRGKIDRLDRIDVNDQAYLAVVDYKSSRHTFDYRDAYFGLAMQMITYLDVALSNAVMLIGTEKAKPAGAFYLQIKNPTVEGNLPEDVATEELFKEYGYKGILLNEAPLLERLDLTLDEQPKSSVFPYNMKKNGEFSSSQFVTEGEVELLIQHNRHNFKEAGQEIFNGATKLNPAYRDKLRVACQYCPFRSVCQFDVMLKENEYHRIEKLKKDDVLNKIVEEGNQDV